jgi:hypothetical protein
MLGSTSGRWCNSIGRLTQPLSAHDSPRDRAALAVLVDARWCAARLETVRLMAFGLSYQDVEVVGHAIVAMP